MDDRDATDSHRLNEHTHQTMANEKKSVNREASAELSLSDLIGQATNEIARARARGGKSGYRVEELTLELHVTATSVDGAGLKFSVLGVGGGLNTKDQLSHAHKITLKLKPSR